MRLWYREARGIELPPADEQAAAVVLAAEAASARWEAVTPEHARPGDVLLLRLPGERLHAALVWRRPGHMLHVLEGRASRVERYDRPPWSVFVMGAYTWRG